MINEGGPPMILKRSIRHLIPIEVSCNDEPEVSPMVDLNSNEDSLDCHDKDDTNDSSAPCSTNCSRPRQQAVILGERTRRTVLILFAPFCNQTGGVCWNLIISCYSYLVIFPLLY